MRTLALAKAPPGELLAACDALRDAVLPALGVRVDDRPNGETGGSLWKLCDPEELRAEAEREAQAGAAREEGVKAVREEARRKAAEREMRARVTPAEMFRGGGEYAGQFSAWDAEGLPTADSQGLALSKSAAKKLLKAHEAQAKAHEAWRLAQLNAAE